MLPADEELAAWLAAHVPRERVVLVANKAEGRAAQEGGSAGRGYAQTRNGG